MNEHDFDPVDVEELLLQMREIVETARSVPMSASVMINQDDVIGLLEEIGAALPEELRRARWLLKERDEFLGQARRDAEEIIEAARVQAARMVERTEIVREARRTSQQVVDDAEATARQLKHEAEDYIDQKLASFEVVLERTMQTVHKGRERLQVVIEPTPEELAEEQEAIDAMESSGFFDQDAM